MLTHPKPSSYPLPGALFLCLLTLLFLTSLRSCTFGKLSNHVRAQASQLPAVSPTLPAPKPPPGNIDPAMPLMALSQASPQVRNVIQHLRGVRHWKPLPGFKGGRTFRNLEGLLPGGKAYREYDVRPLVSGVSRGAERIVVDASRRNFYYTSDHYQSFTQILLP